MEQSIKCILMRQSGFLDKYFILLLMILLAMLMVVPLVRFDDLKEGLLSTQEDYKLVPGVILKSEAKYTTGGLFRFSTGYLINISYEYYIDGTRYISNKYSFGQSKFKSKQSAQRITNEYSSGDSVSVYVKKNNYHLAVLNFDRNSNKDFILLALILLGISTFAIYDYKKRAKKLEAKAKNGKPRVKKNKKRN